MMGLKVKAIVTWKMLNILRTERNKKLFINYEYMHIKIYNLYYNINILINYIHIVYFNIKISTAFYVFIFKRHEYFFFRNNLILAIVAYVYSCNITDLRQKERSSSQPQLHIECYKTCLKKK